MARIARVVVPGVSHPITQRGNRRMQTFFNDDDYQAYIALMAVWCREFQVEVGLLSNAEPRSHDRGSCRRR